MLMTYRKDFIQYFIRRLNFSLVKRSCSFKLVCLTFYFKSKSEGFKSVGTQEDASEFLITLLESISKATRFTKQHANRTATVKDDIFSFKLTSQIKCVSCQHVSDTIENTSI